MAKGDASSGNSTGQMQPSPQGAMGADGQAIGQAIPSQQTTPNMGFTPQGLQGMMPQMGNPMFMNLLQQLSRMNFQPNQQGIMTNQPRFGMPNAPQQGGSIGGRFGTQPMPRAMADNSQVASGTQNPMAPSSNFMKNTPGFSSFNV